MAESSPNAQELAASRCLAATPQKVALTTTAKYDLMGAGLSKDELCSTIIAYIDGEESVRKVTLKGAHGGQPAFVMKPRIDNSLFYLKVTLCELGEADEYMLIVSAHPDH